MRFEETPEGRELLAESCRIAEGAAKAWREYCEMAGQLHHYTAKGEGYTNEALQLKQRLKPSMDAKRAEHESLVAQGEESQRRVNEARRLHAEKVKPELIEAQRKAARKLITALEPAVVANAELSAAETELRELGVEFERLLYPELSHAGAIGTEYSRWLQRCRAAGVKGIPESGPVIPAVCGISATRHSDAVSRGSSAYAAAVRPTLDRQRSLIEGARRLLGRG